MFANETYDVPLYPISSNTFESLQIKNQQPKDIES